MAGPLNVEVVAVVEGELDVLALELVDDGAVVDAMDGDPATIALIEEAVVLFAKFGDVDGGYAEFVFVDMEVGQGLLVVGFDLGEDYVFGIVVSDDYFAQECPIALLGVTAEMPFEIGLQAVGFDVLAGEEILVAEDGGEGLHLDQFRVERAVGVANEAEVDCHEVGDGVVVGDAILRGDGLLGGLHVRGVVKELMGELGAYVG